MLTDPRKLIRKVDDLPTLPSVVARVNEMVGDPSVSAGDINDVISKDVALSARILKLVNSAFYGFPRRIASVTHAIVILGFNALRNVTLSASVFDLLDSRDLPFGHREFWIHSIGVAVAANVIARERKLPDVEDAFMCGLLHDVGKIVLHQYARGEFGRVLKKARDEDMLLYDAETAILGTTHAQVGGLLAEEWKLPAKMAEVVSCHHDPMSASTAAPLASAVHVGDVFARALMIGSGGDRKIPRVDPRAWEMLQLGAGGPEQIIRQTASEIRTADAFVDMI